MRVNRLVTALVLTVAWVMLSDLSAMESKKEAAARLAAEKAAKQIQTLQSAVVTTTAKTGKSIAGAVQEAGAAADANAIAAQVAADRAALLIQQATLAASAAAITAQAQAVKAEQSYIANSIALIVVQLLILVGIVGGFINSAFISSREHKWAMEAQALTQKAVADTQQIIAKVEEHTNGMHAALMKAAFKDGEEAERVKSAQ